MKKVVGLILTIFMLISFAISVNAEEFNGADLFTIDLPDDFEQTGTNVTDFTFTNENGDTFSVSYSENIEEKGIFSPADMSKKDIEKYMNTLTEETEAVMKDFADGFKIRFLSGESVKCNGKTALACQTKTIITNNNKDNIYYQTMYEFGGINNKYTFTYTTSDESQKDSFNDVFDTINIFEEETRSGSDKLLSTAVAGFIILLFVAGIIRFIRTPEKRAQGKIK